MRPQIVITLAVIIICDAKLPTVKSHLQSNELPPNPTQNSQAMRLLEVQAKSAKTSRIVNEYKARHRRDTFDSKSYNENSLIWAHSERLDENGDVVLRWVKSDSSVTFRVEARTRGYVGIGFNSARNMRGADLVVAWVDDRNNHAHVLVSSSFAPVVLFPRILAGGRSTESCCEPNNRKIYFCVE